MTILLDGPLGTQLAARGVSTSGAAWSASAIVTAPEILSTLHRSYAEAGARVHTADTFRTTRRAWGPGWQDLATTAVRLARDAVPADHRVAGSIAPLEDCYQPERSPPDPEPEHRALAEVLAHAGVDLLLCETFPQPQEALAAVRAATATGVETWLALTAGPTASLLTPAQMAETALLAARAGATTVLVNCVPATDTLRFVRAIAATGVPTGAYANAGSPTDGIGWAGSDPVVGPRRYAELARGWVQAGARVVGGCCGTGPAHIRALARSLETAS
jgi:S-methylmethionine-dependent homocysteine/selenocysteine methylase